MLSTLSRPSAEFVHQYVVDAYAAQHATETTKPIYMAFALAGLYLHNECSYSGKRVQQAHMQLAKNKKSVPAFRLPVQRGEVTVHDVLRIMPGLARDEAIQRWSASAWNAYIENRASVISWVRSELNL